MNDDYEDPMELDSDQLPPPLSSRIEHLSRKWMDEDDDHRPGRPQRRTRRRIEDWREARSLSHALDDQLERE